MNAEDPNHAASAGAGPKTTGHAGQASPRERRAYQIVVEGHLDNQWAEWFEGLSISHVKDGTTVLSGPVPDQAALHGLLVKIRNLGLPLVSINQIE